jgi:hypothetical protein
MPGSSKWSLSLRFPHRNPVYASPLIIHSTWPAHDILLDFIARTILVRITDYYAYYVVFSSLLSNVLVRKQRSYIHSLSLHLAEWSECKPKECFHIVPTCACNSKIHHCQTNLLIYHNNVTNLIHFHFHNHFIVSWSSTCLGCQASIFRRHYTSSFLVWFACTVAFGWLQVVGRLSYWDRGCGCRSGGLVGCGLTCWS